MTSRIGADFPANVPAETPAGLPLKGVMAGLDFS
jgi:hypothetical protein